MHGPERIARAISQHRYRGWQYHSRSDHHSKVICWTIVFDLLTQCNALRDHARAGLISFGINQEMRDFKQNRKKNLDLVVSTPSGAAVKGKLSDLLSLQQKYQIPLSKQETSLLREVNFQRRAVGSVLIALEAKATMTAHRKALPRLYDELNSSHSAVHGANDHAIAAGFALINGSERFISPDRNKGDFPATPVWSRHKQPGDVAVTMKKVEEIPRRSRVGADGFDAAAIVVFDCQNDGSEIRPMEARPAPQPGEIYHYQSMIERICNLYQSRFKEIR